MNCFITSVAVGSGVLVFVGIGVKVLVGDAVGAVVNVGIGMAGDACSHAERITKDSPQTTVCNF